MTASCLPNEVENVGATPSFPSIGSLLAARPMRCWIVRILVALLLALTNVSQSFANEWDKADFLSVADVYGDAKSAYALGDYATAFRLFKPLAEHGDMRAQSAVGYMYYMGRRVEKDFRQARYWYEKAAAQGEKVAQNNLGAMYANGEGVTRDIVRAVFWYRKSAEQGYGLAQASLGNRYATGDGVTKDYVSAYMWLTLAGSQGVQDAITSRDRLEVQMTSEQIEDAHDRARRWRARSTTLVPDDFENDKPAAFSKPATPLSFGSGFFVTAQGHVLTNAHVVKDCSGIAVESVGMPAVTARVIATDFKNDLAVVLSGNKASSVARIETNGPRLGDSVVVYGFPLADTIASSGNVTVGNVSALAGISDDSRMLQISAAVQPGSSGGPVMNLRGGVVGVVVGKLALVATAPQNVNFAIKANVAKIFLESHGVDYQSMQVAPEKSVADIAEDAQRFSVRIFCY
jgi:hypothetical protein